MSALAAALRGLAILILLLVCTERPLATAGFSELEETVHHHESALDARVGVLVREVGTERRWAHRADERFLMNSAVKALICAAVLDAAERGALSLDEALPIRASDLVPHAPLAERRVGEAVEIAELCRAAVDLSDNTAANLLIARLGGPAAVTAFLRGLGDAHTRLDRMEPELNVWAEGDERDTTTPEAVLLTLELLLLGDALAPGGRAQLTDWMSRGSYTGAFLRAAAPPEWSIADKSGAGEVTRTLVALVSPPGRAPWLVAIFVSEAEVDFVTRNAAVASISAAVVAALRD
ncbi:MAG: class A beta-lactamase [Pseudomonadales bacterium]|nr:class A beta-lactamase [Pseudomonadales bacterium]